MSATEISPIRSRMARPKKYVEDMVARFLAGTFARIQSALRPGEDRADLVRDAVERELKRRDREAAGKLKMSLTHYKRRATKLREGAIRDE